MCGDGKTTGTLAFRGCPTQLDLMPLITSKRRVVDKCFAPTGSSGQNQHSYSWYQNASESDRKPLAQTTTLKTGSKVESTTYDSWDAIMGLRPPSPSPEPWNPAPTPSLVSAGSCEGGGLSRRDKAPFPPRPQSPSKRQELPTDSDYLVETTDLCQMSSSSLSSSLVKNSNCRTYRRPNKQGSASKASDPAEPPSAHLTHKAEGQGRTRDYTVLHPSAVSVSNITIQNRGVDQFPTDSASSDAAAGLGSTNELGSGAGWQRKKMEPPQHGR